MSERMNELVTEAIRSAMDCVQVGDFRDPSAHYKEEAAKEDRAALMSAIVSLEDRVRLLDAGTHVLVPREPTPEMMAAALIAIHPSAPPADIALVRAAVMLMVKSGKWEAQVSVDELAASEMATFPGFYRAMLDAALSNDGGVTP